MTVEEARNFVEACRGTLAAFPPFTFTETPTTYAFRDRLKRACEVIDGLAETIEDMKTGNDRHGGEE